MKKHFNITDAWTIRQESVLEKVKEMKTIIVPLQPSENRASDTHEVPKFQGYP